MKLSLVIPCYNEEGNLPKLIARCTEVFAPVAGRVEVILVNNGSKDSSAEILKNLPEHGFIRTVHVPVNQGYGYGILQGLKAAKGEYLGWTHADLQCDPKDALAALELIEKTAEPAFYKGSRYGRKVKDLVFTWGMSVFDSLALCTWLSDINAQPNIFPRGFYESWKNPPHDFALDLYTYYLARKSGLKMRRFPVFFGQRTAGEAHLNSLKAKLKFTLRTIRYTRALKRELKR